MHTGYIRPDAVAYVKGGSKAPNLLAEVRFYQNDDGVLVKVEASGLPASNASGFYGFHIHEGNGCSGTDFSQSGAHYNPKNTVHPQHAGDLPPLLSYGGDAYMTVMTNRFRVKDIIGRTVIIHSSADDFHTQPSGNSGEKIACGVITAV